MEADLKFLKLRVVLHMDFLNLTISLLEFNGDTLYKSVEFNNNGVFYEMVIISPLLGMGE